MFSPKGSIVRSMRLREAEATEDGAEVTRSISGAGVVVHLKPAVPNMKPADIRRAFARAAKSLGVVLSAVERAHGHFSQSGKPIVEGLVSAYQAVGTAESLRQLVGHFAVSEWHFALNVAVRPIASGSGPEKVRPSMGSQFGKPLTTKSTAEAVAKQTAESVKLLRRSCGLD